ncbi:MAG: mandelate racemase/muconate lactonizing enzyme family protein [Acidobacteriaceae bacterium]|nr:mandelate racemase/muconate lactonizing enzyme family protein [Acidobacteriaceae bacterium]
MLRITGVTIHQLRAPLSRRFGWSLNWTATRTATLVEVSTDAGLTGWGDGYWGGQRLMDHPELVIGRSPFAVEAIFDDLRPAAGHQTRRGEPTAGGLDQALWDLCGQATSQPVCDLLGPRHRSEVQPYLTALYRQDWPDLAAGLAEEAVGWREQGWTRMKMKIGYDPVTDLAAVRAMRRALGEGIGLGVDANCAYDAGTALALGARMEELNLLWWEEPLLADDLAGYDRLSAGLRIPLASGETMSMDRLILDYVQPRRVAILQPDLETVGLTGGRRLSQLCWLNRIRLVPHNWGTAVRTAATLHWLAATPPLTPALAGAEMLFEFDQTESPFRDAVVREPVRPVRAGGPIAVPSGPGLGIVVDPAAVAAFTERRIEIR